jgi:hypothetical protein
METERAFSKRRNMRLPSAKDAFLARLNIVRKRMHWYTIAILIWLTFYLICHLFLWGGINNPARFLMAVQLKPLDLNVGLYLSYTVSYTLWALAIIGIVVHYSRGETPSHQRWGPLFGVAGAVVFLIGIVVTDYFYVPPLSDVSQFLLYNMSPFQMRTLDALGAFFYGPVLVGIPSYVEYLIEGPPAETERVTRAALSQRLSSALTWYIKDLDDTIDQMRKRVRRALTLVTIVLPIAFVAPTYILHPYIRDWNLYHLLLATLYVFSAVLFLILAVWLSSMLRKPRETILALNHSDHFAAVAAAERNGLITEARLRLAIFLFIFAHPVLYWPVFLIGSPFQQYPILVLLTASLTVLLLSAFACFLLGFKALTRSSVAAKALDTPAFKGLLEPSIGIFPTKVRAGEAHSVLINFNLAAKGTTSFGTSTRIFDSDQEPYYEASIQAAGATIDDDKRRAIFDGPSTNENVWDISFANRGTQALHLLLNAVRARSDGHEADRETLFAYVHNVLVEGRLTGSSDNTISSIGVVATVGGVLASALPFVVH